MNHWDAEPRLGHDGNVAGIVAMLAAMLAYCANDTCVKLATEHLPLGEVIVMRNVSASILVLTYALWRGGLSWPAAAPTSLVAWRTIAEITSTIFFLTGLLALPFADANAISQILPLVITAIAVIVLKEHAGWPLWAAIAIGFLGVLLIARPGTSAFAPEAGLILVSVLLVAARDLITRRIGNAVPTLTMTLFSAVGVISAGLLMLPFETWVWPSVKEALLAGLGGGFLAAGYALSIIAMRFGTIAVVSPFRYSIILYSLVIGWLVWGEWPDELQMLGIGLLVVAGVYTLRHQRRTGRAS